jgi:D-glycero-D-manno-heptose 1,7-bisphosphate phosphatase
VKRAVFLDRDGTLNRQEVGEPPFVTRAEDLVMLPGMQQALQAMAAMGFMLVVVTNQSGVARGFYSEAELARIHARMHRELAELPVAWLHCPHLPEAAGPYGGLCECRKPRSGLLVQARELLGIDDEGSVLVGDSARDLLIGEGLPMLRVLVQSGKPWQAELATLRRRGVEPDAVLADVPATAAWLRTKVAKG